MYDLVAGENLMFYQYLVLLIIHYIGDFVCQTHWQASNKSKNNEALFRHVIVYTCVLMVGSFIVIGPWWITSAFIVVNGVLHFITDYFTSRWSSKLYAKQDWHNFFVVIGLDQLIHQMTLAGTLYLMLG